MTYRISFAASVAEHLAFLTAAERARVLDTIERQLESEPTVATRNRTPLRPNPLAPWELRVGALRVFYEATPDEPDTVLVLAVGKKERSVLRIAGREIAL